MSNCLPAVRRHQAENRAATGACRRFRCREIHWTQNRNCGSRFHEPVDHTSMPSFTRLSAYCVTTNVMAFEVPPPGDGFATVTATFAGRAMSTLVIFAVNLVRLEPFHMTCEEVTKPLPSTVKINAAPFALAEEGLRLTMAGTGLAIVNVLEFEVPPPGVGLRTVTAAVPLVAMSEARMTAVNRDDDMKVVVRSDPFQRTVEVGTKPAPSMVITKFAPPTRVVLGTRRVIAGAGLLTVKYIELEIPPPGAGLKTSTTAEVAEAMSALVI